MIFKAMIFSSFDSVFFRIRILFFSIAAKKTCSESAINVCLYVFLYVFLYVLMNDCRPTSIEGHVMAATPLLPDIDLL